MALSYVHLDMFESRRNHATKIVTASATKISAKDRRKVGLLDRRAIFRNNDSMVFPAIRVSLMVKGIPALAMVLPFAQSF
jgi:hypothetical protein